jgi:hypothetical protein
LGQAKAANVNSGSEIKSATLLAFLEASQREESTG